MKNESQRRIASTGIPRRISRCVLPVAIGVAAAVTLTGCGTSSDADPTTESAVGGDEICALLTSSVQEATGEGMTSVLKDAQSTGAKEDGAACVERFTAGDSWVELTYRDVTGADDSGLSPVAETLLTDGARTSRALLDGRAIEVVADTSDPRSISTWDASLVGAGALTSG